MLVLKVHSPSSKVLSLVVILALIQAGLLGSGASVLAEVGGVPQTVYESIPPPGVATAVYQGEKQGPVLPSSQLFLREEILDQLPAPSGKFTVSGQVYENSTGMPLAGVSVQLMRDGHPTQFRTSTDSEGIYNLTGVGSGSYTLLFKHPGYTPESFGADVFGADLIQLCNLLRNTSFKGRIVNELRQPVEGAAVTLADQNIRNRSLLLSTNADGRFYLTEVPPGRYKISVSQSVYQVQKMIWVDEYPMELEMVLRGGQPLPPTVTEAVYGEAADPDAAVDNEENDTDTAVDEEPTVIDEVYNDSAEGGEESQLSLGRSNPVEPTPPSDTRTPFKTVSNWITKLVALREHDPLNELDQLLKEQAKFV